MEMKNSEFFTIILVTIISNGNGILIHPPPSPLTLQLMVEYAKYRSWEQIVLFDDLSNGNNDILYYARTLISCLSDEGMSLSIQSTLTNKLSEALNIRRHRVGAIVLLDRLNQTSAENVLKTASAKRLFDYYVSWLLITTDPNDASIDLILRNLTIGINSDVVVATSSSSAHEMKKEMTNYRNRRFREYVKMYNFQWINSNDFIGNGTKNLEYSVMENRSISFYLVHIYKIRINDNSSLVVDPLGCWNPGAPVLKLPINIALRNNFFQLPIVVGILNGTSDDQNGEITSYEEEPIEVQPMNDFIQFLGHSLNASLEIVAHEKLGTLTNKVWSNLLGDVYTGAVDIGLGYITINEDLHRDMSFTHPLIRYTRNIYIRPPESGTMRDIFLQPFNNRLLFCVALMQIFIIITIGSINYATNNVFRERRGRQTGIGEATLWCTSIMCMQGSPWNPSSLSGKTALLASLIFALVTYNAYAGFITSILSVQATGIKTLDDLLHNNFKLGYSDVDDEYMRNANDSALRQLYIKAFNGRESRLSTSKGLQRAVGGGYGFFASATLARRALRTSLIHERCSLKEIEIRHTFTTVALPMEQNSPYEKIINLSILKMGERGVIDKIREKMLPDMPRCQALTTFHSARIADVYSAFIILAIGIVTSLFLGVIERIWNQRRIFIGRITGRVKSRRKLPPGNYLRVINQSPGLSANWWRVNSRVEGKFNRIAKPRVFPFHH
ncbi:uncharacterized protein [Fopius arisanus]|uniref:Uncharacterized protein n=3 Tax=Fopius arisanus TaxID=64838 RepID=A0A9R1T5Z2_9HYME|nr:PREDICTED: uncharacterized protein LOC105266693 [Fopius arisanus]